MAVTIKTYSGTNYARLIGAAYDPLDPNEMGGRVRFYEDDIEIASASATTTVKFGPFPKGARIVDGFLLTDALGAGVNVKLGDNDAAGADDDRYLTLTSAAASAARTAFPNAACIDKVPYTLTAESYLVLTTAGTISTGGTVKINVLWVLD